MEESDEKEEPIPCAGNRYRKCLGLEIAAQLPNELLNGWTIKGRTNQPKGS